MKLQTPTNTLKVRDFNELLSCQLCGGYLINPATVENCLHTYCRSCIVQHLHSESTCPQCKITGGSKQINVTNLKSDDVLRALIFKLIPGLYQKERERTIQFKGTLRNGQQRRGDCEEVCSLASREQDTIEEDFFAPTEPISLSLEYHPALLEGCSTSQIPPVRYLQCPAGLKIRHLKRFLCSKFDIDPESKRIEVEVIYEDEVLPNDFTLMDVGYCYNWKRHAPMKFTYRILFYGDERQKQDKDCKKSDIEAKQNQAADAVNVIGKQQNQELTVCDESDITTLSATTSLPTNLHTGTQSGLQKPDKSKNKTCKVKRLTTNKIHSHAMSEEIVAPVKMIIARKSSADSGKKPSPKHSNNEDVTYMVTNDFKSLRSNDMRYSDYAVSSTTSNSNSPKSSPKSAQRSPRSGDVANIVDSANTPVVMPKCDIVVSIPQSQMPKSPYAVDDEFENVSLAQLKTASKKSPPSATTTTFETPKSATTRNVPKLKIELNSLKTRLSISKPKSVGVLQGADMSEKRQRTKQRKHSLDEVAAPLTDHLDLETYAKNIGLQPIEVLTPPESAECGEKLKYSPNASPLSSASSTTSSSNNAFPLAGAAIELTTTTSFHKKRKKKHSRDSKDPKEGKRRRMHAEISSKPEEESLKMKVKLTPSHNHKSHKSENSARKNSEEARKSQAAAAVDKTFSQSQTEIDNILALNKTLGEESRSINHLMRENEKAKESVQVVKADETLLALSHAHLLPKPVNNIKDTKLPASPPLPPSLFKTTPLSFNALTVTSTTAGSTKHTANVGKPAEITKLKQLLPATLKPAPVTQYNRQGSLSATAPKAHPNFIVPSLPRRPTTGTNCSYTPTSIASSNNKQLGLQLKRSASLDESYALTGRGKQPKLDAAQRKILYSSYASKPAPSSTNIGTSKIATDSVTHASSAVGSTNSGITITARPTGDTAQVQSHWKLPPYTPLHLPFNKPAVEIVRINSQQNAVDIQLHPAAHNVTKTGRIMAPPLPMNKAKKANTQAPLALSTAGFAVKTPPIALNAKALEQPRNHTYRVPPPALVNLQTSTMSSVAKKVSAVAADTAATKKPEILDKTNGNATGKQIQQRRNSLRDFRLIRDHNAEIVDITGSKDDVRPADTTTSTAVTSAPSARESLEAALNKIKQNIASTTVPDNSAAAVAKQQQQQSSSTELDNDGLQNLHLLSESATAREKLAIRASQSYEKPKIQQSTLVRQQNASVRNIPNPSALAFRNMSTLPAVGSTSARVTTTNPSATSSSTTPKTSATVASAVSTPTQPKSALTPLTSSTATLSTGHSITAPTTTTTTTSASNNANSSTATAARTVKKPTTIDQVAANLNMRASAAAAEAHAAKVHATEDPAQISSSTSVSATVQSKINNLTKPKTKTSISGTGNMASSTTATTTNVPSVAVATETVERAREQQTNKALKATEADEGLKAKVLPKSIGDSGVTTTIVTDVASIKSATNNNNNNNNSNNNNNHQKKNNNSNNSNSKLGVTAASVASD